MCTRRSGDALHLFDVIETDDWDDSCSDRYRDWEQRVARPLLEAAGYHWLTA